MAHDSLDAREGDTPVLIGESPVFAAMWRRIDRIATLERTTFLVGPTGSGKDVIARVLHGASSRRARPFVAIHCAALPENLVEAELFGHARGAFTGAVAPRSGLIRAASRGTLFLDEVDSLSPGAQAKLLRFLESGEFRAVGSDQIERSDAWIVAATNRDLTEAVRKGEFRADLLYRLDVLRVDVPSLRDRISDVLPLARHFLERIGCGGYEFSTDAIAAMCAYPWPGNVRELKHRVESAALLSAFPHIDAEMLGLRGVGASGGPRADATRAGLDDQLWALIDHEGLTLPQAVEQCEQWLIARALERTQNNRTRAAERLGIHIRTLYKKLETQGVPVAPSMPERAVP